LPCRNTLQVILVFGKEFFLLQHVFFKSQFLIGNEPAMKFIDLQDGLVVKLDRVLRLIHPLKSKVYSIQGPLDLPGRFLNGRRGFVHSERLDDHRLKRRLQV